MTARNINWNVPKPKTISEIEPDVFQFKPDIHETIQGFFLEARRNCYLSEHSDKEYETLLKAFLLLGERYDKLQSDYEEALGDIDDMIEQQIIEDEYRDWQGE